MAKPHIYTLLQQRERFQPARVKRQRLSHLDRLYLLHGLSIGLSAEVIARNLPCSEATVRRYIDMLYEYPDFFLEGLQPYILTEAGDSLRCSFCNALRPGGKNRAKAVEHVLSHVIPQDQLRPVKIKGLSRMP
jgi:hypothetical protein